LVYNGTTAANDAIDLVLKSKSLASALHLNIG